MQRLKPSLNSRELARHGRLPPNNALERAVRRLALGAAGAWESLAPAAPGTAVARPAQRGR